MQVVSISLFPFDNPALAALSIVGLIGVVAFIGAAVLRTRGDRRWDKVFLGGGVLIAVAFVGTLLYSWIASPVPQ